MELDPDDPRPPYVQVANLLRAAILTGRYTVGTQLPSGPELSTEFKVARMTIQQAIRVLRSEGLVVSRQGSGVFVRDRTQRSVELRPHIEAAFEAENVVVDFAGFSAETLNGVLSEPLDKIRVGRLTPATIHLRLLLPDTSRPMVLPCDATTLTDDPEFRGRLDRLQLQQTEAIRNAAGELNELGLVRDVSISIRRHALPPLFKLFIINRSDSFFGFYPIRRREVPLFDTTHDVFDLMGKDSVLFRYESADPKSHGAPFISEAQQWFDSVWSHVSWEMTT